MFNHFLSYIGHRSCDQQANSIITLIFIDDWMVLVMVMNNERKMKQLGLTI